MSSVVRELYISGRDCYPDGYRASLRYKWTGVVRRGEQQEAQGRVQAKDRCGETALGVHGV